MKRPVSYEKVFAKFPANLQRRVKARAKELIAEEMALRDIRNIQALTPGQVAKQRRGKRV